MIRDYAPLAARKLDVRLPAQRTEEDDWVARLPSGAKVKSIPASAGSQSVRVVLRESSSRTETLCT